MMVFVYGLPKQLSIIFLIALKKMGKVIFYRNTVMPVISWA
jgi:hypothetical protein